MTNIRKLSITVLAFIAMCGAGGMASGSPVGTANIAIPRMMQPSELGQAGVVLIAHKKHRFRFSYDKQHIKFHHRYHPNQTFYRRGHYAFHRHHRHRHEGPEIYLGWGYPFYYDPFYYSPDFYDPYYYSYRVHIRCAEAGSLLRYHGYRNVRAYDCSGGTYGFYATRGGSRFRISVSAWDGRILRRTAF